MLHDMEIKFQKALKNKNVKDSFLIQILTLKKM